ncbi:hypothetical protein EMCG_07529 [[Emmonsia] crescens]|uniref:Alcohol dehydrogenase-like C-terminal domain-containing protein n=1 Tax=[Emmonsia] crescens TaxID=73230 RepID=A0A0G2JB35_9EURO|nr:hypothetical protein EMCG_07529 [Emmonsia crescens UAMH 3008]
MATTTNLPLPATMRALVRTGNAEPLQLQEVATPTPTHGSVVVKILHATMDASLQRIISGQTSFTYTFPSTPGSRAIGRVAAIGPDTTSFSIGQLVMLEPSMRPRDNEDLIILWGFHDGWTPTGKKFVEDNWRQGLFAEYARCPLENCWALNEQVLCGELGYSTAELSIISIYAIAFAGFRNVNLMAGETVVVAPATGSYSGAAVGLAVAMGANVIAAGRNMEVLEKLRATHGRERVKIVQLKGDAEADTAAFKAQFGRPAEVFIDVSPPQASGSTIVKSGLMALKPYGRAVLMGFISDDNIAVPYAHAIANNLTIRGQYMYQGADVRGLLKLFESGILKLGKSGGVEVVGQFKLEEHEKAGKVAIANPESGKIVVLSP